jgi:hypothetical protein
VEEATGFSYVYNSVGVDWFPFHLQDSLCRVMCQEATSIEERFGGCGLPSSVCTVAVSGRNLSTFAIASCVTAGVAVASISSSSCRAIFFCVDLYAGDGILCPLAGGEGKKSWMDDGRDMGEIFPVARDFSWVVVPSRLSVGVGSRALGAAPLVRWGE